MKCPACENIIVDNSIFCSKCGVFMPGEVYFANKASADKWISDASAIKYIGNKSGIDARNTASDKYFSQYSKIALADPVVFKAVEEAFIASVQAEEKRKDALRISDKTNAVIAKAKEEERLALEKAENVRKAAETAEKRARQIAEDTERKAGIIPNNVKPNQKKTIQPPLYRGAYVLKQTVFNYHFDPNGKPGTVGNPIILDNARSLTLEQIPGMHRWNRVRIDNGLFVDLVILTPPDSDNCILTSIINSAAYYFRWIA